MNQGQTSQIAMPPQWSSEGYSAAELDAVQAKWGLLFPSDLRAFLRRRRPYCTGNGFFDWVHSPDHEIRQLLSWPFNGFWFDVQHNNVWWPDWGPKPAGDDARKARLVEVFAAAPKLIPVFGRRYLPATPCEVGNPVLSVYQTDVTCYGETLAEWLRIEFEGLEPPQRPAAKEIPFWSEAIRQNLQAADDS